MDDKVKKTEKAVVCLGGGIGTVNLIKGLKLYTKKITVVVSAADDGGSAGRLRRLYNSFPPGDAVSCLAALVPDDDTLFSRLLTYRFPGNRYARDDALSGHKLGNLMFVAAKEITGDVQKALLLLESLFHTHGKVLPATTEELSLSARTVDNLEVKGEQTIDLGKYKGNRILEEVFIHPSSPAVPKEVIQEIEHADGIIAGPGDLYTTILPVLLIPAIKEALAKSRAKKIYIVNVANKPFETKGYSVLDYISAITKHLSEFPFETVVLNSNTSYQIPKKYHYTYVFPPQPTQNQEAHKYAFIVKDLVDPEFPLYHEPKKLASVVIEHI